MFSITNIKSKLAVTAVVAAGALALPAVASAAWTGVNVSPTGTLTASSTASTITVPGVGPVTCNVNLGNVTVDATGHTVINSVVITGGGLCSLVTATNLPWTDQICVWTDASGAKRTYDLIDAHLSVLGSPVAGQLAAELRDSSGNSDPTGGLTPASAYLEDNQIDSTGYSVAATYALSNPSGVTGTENAGSGCPVAVDPNSEPPSGW